MPKPKDFDAFSHPEPHLACIKLVYSGTDPRLSLFLGMYGIPPRGGWYWWAVDGDHGEAGDEEEAQREIMESWRGCG